MLELWNDVDSGSTIARSGMIIGLRRSGNILAIAPCIPPDWSGYDAWYRYGQTRYHIQVVN